MCQKILSPNNTYLALQGVFMALWILPSQEIFQYMALQAVSCVFTALQMLLFHLAYVDNLWITEHHSSAARRICSYKMASQADLCVQK